ncbi:MAG: DEAD/DEAH box helicase [Candidatus Methanofastidiosia archaeon]
MASSFELLHPKVKDAFVIKGFKKQTLPQKMGIPTIIEGKNVLIIARTGSGKTEAAILPIFSRILENDNKGIKAIYIAPLRALNRDLLERMSWWADKLGIKIEVRHADTTAHHRRKQALSPPDLLITTPETLQAILTGKVLRRNLKSVKNVVVDEIHELASDKRGTQLAVGLERLSLLSGEFQRIGLSATVGSPEKIAKFLCGVRPVEIIDATTTKEFNISVEFPLPIDEDEELAEKLSTTKETAARVRRIQELVETNESVLTFVNTREMAEALSSRFNLLSQDMDVHHSSLSRKVRIETEKRFKTQKVKCIICTSSMELGIDVGSVSFVVQYMSPRQVSRLIQRVGRSGHKVSETPKGSIIAIDADDILEAAVIARHAKANLLEPTSVYDKPYDVLAHQIVGLSMDVGDVKKGEAFALITRAYPYMNLTWEEFEDVLKMLSSLRLIWVEDDYYHKSKYALQYYFDNLSVIPDVRKFRVIEVGTNNAIGALDEEFVVDRANIGMNFIMKGRAWNVLDVNEDRVLVEEIDNMGAVPAWEGELIPVPFEIAREVSKLKYLISEKGHDLHFVEKLKKDYSLTEDAYEKIEKYIESQKEFEVPRPDEIYVEFIQNLAVFHTGFGSKVNETIGRVLAALYSSKFGTSVAIKSDAYTIGFKFPSSVDRDDVIEVLENLRPEDIFPLLKLSLKRSTLFSWKISHVATRFGALSRDAERFRVRAIINIYQDTPIFEETYKELFFDKLDVKTSEKIFSDYKKGKIKLSFNLKKRASPFSSSLLSKFGYGELIGPKRPEKEVLKILKKRLEERRVRLFCIYCGKWHASVKIGNMDDYPRCPLCSARFLAIIDKKDEHTRKALIKRMRKHEITPEEEELVVRAKRSADLMLVYGKKAALALSAHGLGAQSAARVLAKMHPDEKSFLKDILEAEKTYARTRRFWS